MSKNVGFNLQASIFQLILLVASSGLAHAQTTGFTYQGRLTVDGAAANGNYDLQFALFDSLSGGTQVGSTQTLNTVAVSNGVFTVSLDFGANAFPGATRFLQISARQSGAGGFTLLSPRQPITSTPYAVRSLNAASAETVTINGNQAFRVSGVGSFANSNTFVGVGAGVANTPDAGGVGSSNSFFGKDAGFSNTTGSFNSFFGTGAGRNNSTGTSNSFLGKLPAQVIHWEKGTRSSDRPLEHTTPQASAIHSSARRQAEATARAVQIRSSARLQASQIQRAISTRFSGGALVAATQRDPKTRSSVKAQAPAIRPEKTTHSSAKAQATTT